MLSVKYVLIWVPFLLLMDILALHDILAGEPDIRMEWMVLSLSLVAYGLLIVVALKERRSGQTGDLSAGRR